MMTSRWTKPRPDGKPHEANQPCSCAHCSHVFPGFNMEQIIRHCRQEHRAFYRLKWDTELGPHQYNPNWEPLP